MSRQHLLMKFLYGSPYLCLLLILSTASWQKFLAPTEIYIAPTCFFLSLLGATLNRCLLKFPRKSWNSYRRLEIKLVRLLGVFGLPLCLLAWLLPLWSGLDLSPHSQPSNYGALFGRAPWSDAADYFGGARHLLDTGQLDDWNNRRPLNAALLAVRLALCGSNLYGAVILQALLLGFATWFVARVTGREFGLWAGLAFFAVVYVLGSPYSNNLYSEGLGLSLGCLAFGLIITGVWRRDQPSFLWGLFGFSLAMASRVGALFIFPCYLLLASKLFSRQARWSWSPCIKAVIVILLGFAVNPVLLKLYGTPDGAFQANFSYTALALTAGTPGWKEARELYSTEIEKLTAREESEFLYQRAWEHFMASPVTLFNSLCRGAATFLRIMPLVTAAGLGVYAPAPSLLRLLLNIALLMLWLFGVVRFMRTAHSQQPLFWVASFLGFILSVSVLFTDGGVRVLAATYPLLALSIAVGCSTGKMGRVARTRPGIRYIPVLLVALVVIALAGPRLGYFFHHRPPSEQMALAAYDTRIIVARTDLQNGVWVSPNRGFPAAHGVTLTLAPHYFKFFISHIRSFEATNELIKFLDTYLDSSESVSGVFVGTVYDYVSQRQRYVLIKKMKNSSDQPEIEDKFVTLTIFSTRGTSGQMFDVVEYGALPNAPQSENSTETAESLPQKSSPN